MGASASGSFYRAVWRWHFYAGLLVLPLLAWLAVTGGVFVFKDQIDDYFHADLRFVPASALAVRAPGVLVAAALAGYPGQVRSYTPPSTPTASAAVGIALADGRRLQVYVDPRRARVLGTLPEGGSVATTVRKLHSLKYFGPVARGAVELAAGWAILLVLTGVYLWWPRAGKASVLSVRGQPRQRVFWRDLHATTGVLVGAMLTFLAVTGMPWSVLWGAQVNQWANGSNFGYPAGVRVQLPMSQQRLADATPTAWSLGQARLPLVAPPPASGHEGHQAHEGHEGHGGQVQHGAAPGALSLDQAVLLFTRLGIAPGYTVLLPTGPRAPYSASVYPHDLQQQRVIHLDQYSGKTLIDMRYADYGPLGRWLEWGINVHLGQQFGVPNQALLVVTCLAILLLCVSACIMWWKRRPRGSLGVPALPVERRAMRTVFAMLFCGGLLFPLVGASLLLIAALDWYFLVRGGRAEVSV
ncbi:PepSY-associated TM helix domain-containing protein [Massilia sp. S19_KUP03_FR1]|uniref:PepSY-associated TM helix domain-containing protein n=1 Tax=Massilia sp. S19_KUP03_FR1 TaxID=3025503 RepID=UPI002FCDB6BE